MAALAHPSLPLSLTGNIVSDDSGRIVAHGLDPVAALDDGLPDEPYTVMQRISGPWLLAVNDPEYGLVTAARDGFDSAVATEGRKRLHALLTMPVPGERIKSEFTYIFSLGPPDVNGLWLLGVRHAGSGDEVVAPQLLAIVERLRCWGVVLDRVISDPLAARGSPYVLRFGSGYRVDLAR